jgi:hypothetical protein
VLDDDDGFPVARGKGKGKAVAVNAAGPSKPNHARKKATQSNVDQAPQDTPEISDSDDQPAAKKASRSRRKPAVTASTPSSAFAADDSNQPSSSAVNTDTEKKARGRGRKKVTTDTALQSASDTVQPSTSADKPDTADPTAKRGRKKATTDAPLATSDTAQPSANGDDPGNTKPAAKRGRKKTTTDTPPTNPKPNKPSANKDGSDIEKSAAEEPQESADKMPAARRGRKKVRKLRKVHPTMLFLKDPLAHPMAAYLHQVYMPAVREDAKPAIQDVWTTYAPLPNPDQPKEESSKSSKKQEAKPLCAQQGHSGLPSTTLVFTHSDLRRLDHPEYVAFAKGFVEANLHVGLTMFQCLMYNVDRPATRYYLIWRHEHDVTGHFHPDQNSNHILAYGGRGFGAWATLQALRYNPKTSVEHRMVPASAEPKPKVLVLISWQIRTWGYKESKSTKHELTELEEDVDVLLISGDEGEKPGWAELVECQKQMKARVWLVRVRGCNRELELQAGSLRDEAFQMFHETIGKITAEWLDSRDKNLRRMELSWVVTGANNVAGDRLDIDDEDEDEDEKRYKKYLEMEDDEGVDADTSLVDFDDDDEDADQDADQDAEEDVREEGEEEGEEDDEGDEDEDEERDYDKQFADDDGDDDEEEDNEVAAIETGSGKVHCTGWLAAFE